MTYPFFEATAHASPVVASVLLAVLASYVALDFADHMRGATERAARWSWMTAGSIAMGTGIWAMHFVGMTAARFPFEAAIVVDRTALSWLLAVIASVSFLFGASRQRLGALALVGLSCVIGVGIAVMHFAGMGALDLEPGLTYRPGLVAGALALVIAGAGLTIGLSRRLAGTSGWTRGGRQLGLAVLFAGAVAGMHYTAMAATAMQIGTICRTVEGLRVDAIGGTVGVASATLLVLMLLMTALQQRTERRATRLDGSLGIVREELRLMGMTDHATGLPNRLVFQDRLRQAAARAERDARTVAVLFVTLDHFRAIDDVRSDGGNDRVLRQVADLLSGVVRGSDTVAAIGGEQFLIMMDGLSDLAPIGRVAEALRLARTAKTTTAGITLSVGVSIYPGDGALASLVERASVAAETAAEAGGNCHRFFAPAMSAAAIEESRWIDDLREATGRSQMRLHYQPKFHAVSGEMVGVEALLRWNHPARGPVSPVVFIPLAEHCGLISELGRWVVDEACRQMRDWADAGIELPVAINISAQQVREAGLADDILAALARHDLDPHRLTCEITEAGAVEDSEGDHAELARLKAAGVQISIDDFGTGAASLTHLRKLPVHQLKVDRSFVNDVCEGADARSVVAAVVQLAHALGLQVVAEGVETECQRKVLLALGCHQLQGFLFAKPMPAGMLTAQILAATGRMPAAPAVPPDRIGLHKQLVCTGTGAAPTCGTGAMQAGNAAPGNGGDPVRANPEARSGAAPNTVSTRRTDHHRMKAPEAAAGGG